MPRPNWSRSLPRPITIPEVMKIVTLADARSLMRHLPIDHAQRPMLAARCRRALPKAATGGDPVEASIALRLALMIEGVECQMT